MCRVGGLFMGRKVSPLEQRNCNMRHRPHGAGLSTTVEERPDEEEGVLPAHPSGQLMHDSKQIANTFVNVVAGRVLGSGTVLQMATMNRERGEDAPGGCCAGPPRLS